MLFFLVALSVVTFVYVYTGLRIVIPARLSAGWNTAVMLLMLVFLTLPFISIFLRMNGHQNYTIYVLTWISYLSLGFITLVFLFLVVRDIALYTALFIGKIVSIIKNFDNGVPLRGGILNPERRQALVHALNIGILGLTGLMTGWGVFRALTGPSIVNIPLPFSNLPDEFDGFRIVQISDIHVGSTIRLPYIRKIAEMVKNIECDVIVLTGDMADGRVSQLREDAAPLGEITAPLGKYFVTGNHEYYSGVEEWTDEMRRLGYDVLLNENRMIERGGARIIMAGVTDFEGGRFGGKHASDTVKAIQGVSPVDFKILLAHQPKSIFEAEKAGFDLMLSGHTHGGQYFPWNFFIRIQQPYTSGLHFHGKTTLYINHGTGYWGPPMRGGIPSEITVITLKKG